MQQSSWSCFSAQLLRARPAVYRPRAGAFSKTVIGTFRRRTFPPCFFSVAGGGTFIPISNQTSSAASNTTRGISGDSRNGIHTRPPELWAELLPAHRIGDAGRHCQPCLHPNQGFRYADRRFSARCVWFAVNGKWRTRCPPPLMMKLLRLPRLWASPVCKLCRMQFGAFCQE